MMITLFILLNETYTNRYISGDSVYTLIPVGCLGGRLFFQPVVRKHKLRKALTLDPNRNYYIKSQILQSVGSGQTSEGEDDELLSVMLIKLIWKKDFDNL